jgi:hypothetical protein
MTVLRQTMVPCNMAPANLARLVKIPRAQPISSVASTRSAGPNAPRRLRQQRARLQSRMKISGALHSYAIEISALIYTVQYSARLQGAAR